MRQSRPCRSPSRGRARHDEPSGCRERLQGRRELLRRKEVPPRHPGFVAGHCFARHPDARSDRARYSRGRLLRAPVHTNRLSHCHSPGSRLDHRRCERRLRCRPQGSGAECPPTLPATGRGRPPIAAATGHRQRRGRECPDGADRAGASNHASGLGGAVEQRGWSPAQHLRWHHQGASAPYLSEARDQ